MLILEESFREEFDYQLNQIRRITSHGPSIGRFIEYLLIKLLKKYLPKSLDFTSGFIKGTTIGEKCSTQIDIICYDNHNYPLLFNIEEFKVIPSKSVKALIEIKATLTKDKLKDILNSSSAKELKEVPISSKMYIFSTSSSIKPNIAFKSIVEFYQSKPNINKLFSVFYSLDWDEIIICVTKNELESIECEIIHLKIQSKNNIAIFIAFLIKDIYGSDAQESINNHISPSIFIPINSYKFKLYTKQITKRSREISYPATFISL